ncbi:maltose alpha-D-glucosyltransferase [Arthrobacter glacialis]|uniref:maltose alpha-D-glucosyltransferase n=1 Tax=Arthrobacter glacialis TaxID=1664 RepID=A0A2S3ZQY8_ARTGL|nr:maltose alpha-D-glucosyltransferase [Arthrobacter glacialis]POH61295.1 maltose alpha-D-glucosyltransferase [Arthrobacter glacialis]POH71620.1 maltose alpha-D-glucosyltransferase [Arthrobacter glacialis]
MAFTHTNSAQQFNVNAPGLAHDRHWYRKAVFYEVLVQSFADANGDGSGDFSGLISRLDYLQWLGIDCLWLPPFFDSPLLDGGYDVRDFTSIMESYGTISDFKSLVTQAHERGMRIIIDLPLNHTSDQHPWFKASREDPTGPFGDFYMWSDTTELYQDARVIFVDTEESNWTFDPVRRQFFWHRFFSHQPDLNYENPTVREAIFDVVKFWLAQGIDGFRADAIPYLYAEDGTNCENLPATHLFLQDLRAMVDAEFPGRVIIAEANQMPHEVVDYFGTAENPECHMAFHFPIMPRLYYALRDQKAAPIIETMANTPAIPQGAQWGTFLRNHDELTLEMVTPSEREAMLGWYAPDSRMRANIGIRRRLAPLLDNSRAEIELINALLLALPGSPFLYYGDEIGMGDNIWLDDRDASRTPMQWNPDRNAGFSNVDPGKLFLPVVQSLVYHYNHVNVEAQMAHSSSLLHWNKKILAVRKAHAAFGLGGYENVTTSHEAVLAFLRVLPVGNAEGERPESILCVFNLSQHPAATTLHMPELAGRGLREVFGESIFPGIDDDGRLTVTLGSYDFFWLRIRSQASNVQSDQTQALPIIDGSVYGY